MRTKYVHYSRDKELKLEKREAYNEEAIIRDWKPHGLWISHSGSDGWEAWCKSEDFGTGEHKHEVIIAKDNNLLFIHSYGELLDFSQTYKKPNPYGTHAMMDGIDWVTVGSEFQGIMIFPYQYRARFDLMWYNGWDCASGCIWDVAAVKEIRYVGEDSLCRNPRA